jgi:hypothetical protein
MSAIITEEFRKMSAQQLVSDATSGSSSYFVGIGKSDPWVDDSDSDEDAGGFNGIPTPTGSKIEKLEVLQNLQNIVKVDTARAFRVIPRNLIVAGNTYKVYDPNDLTCFEASGGFEPCYVTNSDRQLFICLRNTTGTDAVAAITADEITDLTAPNTVTGINDSEFEGSDSDNHLYRGLVHPGYGDYIFAYVTTLDNTSEFFTTNWTEITNHDYSADTVSDIDSPSEATGGFLYGFTVTNAGSGYTAPVVEVNARKTDGTNVTFASDVSPIITVTLTGNTIGAVEFVEDNILFHGLRKLDIVSASVTVHDSSGSGAIVKPLIAPLEGFGGDNLSLLPSYYVGLRADMEDNFDGQVTTYLPYRQISLIKDAVFTGAGGGAAYSDGDAAQCLRYFGGVDVNPVLTPGDRIWQGGSGDANAALIANQPVAYFDYYDGTASRVYYHQNFNDGQVPPKVNSLEFAATSAAGGSIKGGTEFTYTSVNANEYSPFGLDSDAGFGGEELNGDVIFVDNREKVTRASGQNEELRLIIQF